MANSFDGSKNNNLAIGIIVFVIALVVVSGLMSFVSLAFKVVFGLAIIAAIYTFWKYLTK